MNRLNFIKEMLIGIKDFVVLFPKTFIRESMYYKDLRIGGYDPAKIYQGFSNLQYRGLVKMKNGNITFTKTGKTWLVNSYERYFKLDKGQWDRKWRIVIFDIPTEHHKSRNKLRFKLKLWGFFMLQKSVFVFPYDCHKEISELCEKLNIGDYVDIILADKLGFREKEVRKFFELN